MRRSMKNIPLTLFVGTLFVLGSATWTACSDDDGGDNNNNNNIQQDAGIDAAQDEFAEVTILHTSDIHSHASGYGPFLDYTPDDTADNDMVMGGYSRLATLIGTIRAQQDTANVPVLLTDAGDFTMGTLYDFTAATSPIAFAFLQMMEYDAATLGNHEFDWTPVGTALMISNARTAGFNVPLLASNMITADATPGDEELAALVNAEVIVPKLVLTLSNGMVVGLLGLMGPTADAQAGSAPPVTFEHTYTAIQTMVDDLVDNDGVDMVLVLSHGGIDDAGAGDDVDLAANVDGIHVIASGHAHTASSAPIIENGAYIFEPGEYGMYLSRLDVNFNLTQGDIEDVTYTLIPVDDTIQGDPTVQGVVDAAIAGIDAMLLPGLGVVAATPVVELPFDMERVDWSEHPLGNLCADALRNVATASILATGGATENAVYDMAVAVEGVIRDGMYQGSTHTASFMDVFNVLPLGTTPDQTQTIPIGYPLVTAYLTPAEIKTVGEVSVSLAEVIGWTSAWLHFSGVRFNYDPNGNFMNKVTAVRLCGNAIPSMYGGDEDYFSMVCNNSLDINDTTTLYRVVVDMYALLMLGVVADYGVVLVPKKSDGTPIDVTDMADILSMRIDADPGTAGLQELKPWLALYMFLSTLPDMDSSGLPEIPAAIYNPTSGLGMGRLNAQ